MQLLERDRQMRELEDQLRAMEDGHGQLVLLGGEAGAGKSMLVRAFCDQVHSRARVLTGGCDPLSTPTPLGPLVEIAEALGGPLLDLLTSERPRQQVFEMTRSVLNTSGQPTLLILEDVHWADEATLDLLRYLGRRIASMRLLLIATYRDDEVGPKHPFRVVLGDLATAPGIKRMRLTGLSEHTVAEMAAGTGLNAAELHRLTGGNPFFVTEVLAGVGEEVPESVRDAVLARASRLSGEARATLEAAAIIGAKIDRSVL